MPAGTWAVRPAIVCSAPETSSSSLSRKTIHSPCEVSIPVFRAAPVPRIVRGSVVDQDQLVIGKTLSENACQASPDLRGAVVDRDDDAKEHEFRLRVTRPA